MREMLSLGSRVLLVVFVLSAAAGGVAQSRISVDVDASEAARGILHVTEKMSVTPGRFAIFYPKWIPGEHSPTGPINNMINLRISANGKPIAWSRDNVEMFAFWCDVPRGVTSLDISFDDTEDFGSTHTANLARIKWNRLVFYQRGVTQNKIGVTASLKAPAGWQYATALPMANETGGVAHFGAVDLETFVDSPAIIGRFFKKIPLTDSGTLQEMEIAADNEDALQYSPEMLAGWKNLIRQAHLAFGGQHYNSYRFLLTLSDEGGDEGLEHHQSSEDGTALNALKGGEESLDLGDLLGHEYTHSWNGKYRRPATLYTPDFEKPMEGELLWVYEGLTEYMGYVLPTRSGLWTAEDFRETIAYDAAMMATQGGRNWRPVVDTARAVQFTYGEPRGWRNARRGVDYYYEGDLVWLEVDTLIQKQTGGKKSIDDFLHIFHGGNSGPQVVPYTFNDVVAALNKVTPYDWATFLRQRIYDVKSDAPNGGITNGGYRLEYSSTPNVRIAGQEKWRGYRNYIYGIGMMVADNGTISDVRPDSPAWKAGLAPGMKILGRNNQPFSNDALAEVITAAATSTLSISLQVDNAGVVGNYNFDYHGGLKYPHLVRADGQPDYITPIGTARN
jgi:predicted metalloprotease with PDZ domain